MSEPPEKRDPFEVVAETSPARYRAGERPSIDEYAAGNPELAKLILLFDRTLFSEPETLFCLKLATNDRWATIAAQNRLTHTPSSRRLNR